MESAELTRTIILQIDKDSLVASHVYRESIGHANLNSARRHISGELSVFLGSCTVRIRERRCESCGMVQEECLCVEFTLGG